MLSTGQKFMRLPERVAKQRLKRTLKLAIFGCAIGKTATPELFMRSLCIMYHGSYACVNQRWKNEVLGTLSRNPLKVRGIHQALNHLRLKSTEGRCHLVGCGMPAVRNCERCRIRQVLQPFT